MEYTKAPYEDRLKLRPHSFEILKKFEFKYAPVGFKFLNAESDLKGLGLEDGEDSQGRSSMTRAILLQAR